MQNLFEISKNEINEAKAVIEDYLPSISHKINALFFLTKVIREKENLNNYLNDLLINPSIDERLKTSIRNFLNNKPKKLQSRIEQLMNSSQFQAESLKAISYYRKSRN